MSEAAKTLDGWYCLHDFRTVDWTTWKMLSSDERQAAIHEFLNLVEKWNTTQNRKEGSHALYTIVGQKADFMMMILRPTMEELNEIETEFNKTKLAEFTVPAHSYVSVVELSNYLPAGEDPYQNPQILARLYPNCQKQNMFVFIQWTSAAKEMITGTCFRWKTAKFDAQPRNDWSYNMLEK